MEERNSVIVLTAVAIAANVAVDYRLLGMLTFMWIWDALLCWIIAGWLLKRNFSAYQTSLSYREVYVLNSELYTDYGVALVIGVAVAATLCRIGLVTTASAISIASAILVAIAAGFIGWLSIVLHIVPVDPPRRRNRVTNHHEGMIGR